MSGSVLEMHQLNVEILAQIALRSQWLYVTQNTGLRLAAPLSDEASAVESLLSRVVKSLIRFFYAESSPQRTHFGFRLRGVLCSPLEGLGPCSDPGSRTVTSAPLPREHGDVNDFTEPRLEMDIISDKILFSFPLMSVPSDYLEVEIVFL